MDADQENLTPNDVLCFQHCKKDVDIVCFQIPEICPVCNSNMDTTPVMEMPPFRLPSPFTNGAASYFSLLIRPTNGTFLLDYSNSSDLHVGITDSRGTVYDFDSDGLHTSTVRWGHCLAITLEPRGMEAGLEWDTKLQEFALKPEWQASQYNEQSRNCYHFVISFLQYYGLSTYPSDSAEFCEEIILPRTIQAAKFITLYRKLMKEGCIVNDRSNRSGNAKSADGTSDSNENAENKESETKEEVVYEMAETKL